MRSGKSSKRTAEPGLGPLESEIMAEAWAAPSVTVRDIYERISARRSIAYTTVMTTMDRLYKKELLSRQSEGNAYRYSVRIDRGGWLRKWAKQTIDGLLPRLDPATVAYFVHEAKKANPELITELKRWIKENEK